MGTTNKHPADSKFARLRRLLIHVRWGIIDIVLASYIINEGTKGSKCSGAKAKTGVCTCPHVAREICGACSVNVCIPEKIGMYTRVTRQSCSQCHKAIGRSQEVPYYSRLKVCSSVICLENMDPISLRLAVRSWYQQLESLVNIDAKGFEHESTEMARVSEWIIMI